MTGINYKSLANKNNNTTYYTQNIVPSTITVSLHLFIYYMLVFKKQQ